MYSHSNSCNTTFSQFSHCIHRLSAVSMNSLQSGEGLISAPCQTAMWLAAVPTGTCFCNEDDLLLAVEKRKRRCSGYLLWLSVYLFIFHRDILATVEEKPWQLGARCLFLICICSRLFVDTTRFAIALPVHLRVHLLVALPVYLLVHFTVALPTAVGTDNTSTGAVATAAATCWPAILTQPPVGRCLALLPPRNGSALISCTRRSLLQPQLLKQRRLG
mmetsp:Transcript_21008/g.62843  ORF Transcript_21008/g.62843 Transcript_21008/m.62843 type:complete len:218 (-) Transcript_21008:1566-2219(-)